MRVFWSEVVAPRRLYDAINAAYPDIQIFASTSNASCLPNPVPGGVWLDVRYYLEPNEMVSMFNEWDNVERVAGGGQIVREYSAEYADSGAINYWSTVQSATSEAVFMIGMEHNSDWIKMASYAPLFEHFNRAQWSPDLAGNCVSTIMPVTSDSGFGPLYWVASSTDAGTYYVKLANYQDASTSVTVTIPDSTNAAGDAKLATLLGPSTSSNYPNNVTITPVSSTISGSAVDGWTFTMPGYGFAVLTATS